MCLKNRIHNVDKHFKFLFPLPALVLRTSMSWHKRGKNYCSRIDPTTKLEMPHYVDRCGELFFGLLTQKRGYDVITNESLRVVVRA